MDDDDYMDDMVAAYTAADMLEDDLTAFLEAEAEESSADYAEHEYWDRYLADEALDEYAAEWGEVS